MNDNKSLKNQDFTELTPLLEDIFDVGRVMGYERLHSGFMSQNYRVNTSVGSFFLKRYRDRMNTIIHEIKIAEEYFYKHGIPIILPIKDRYGREAFWCGAWYSIFPFIEGKSPTGPEMNKDLIISLATTLAKIHDAGDRFTFRPFQMIRIGNKRKFLMENVELDRLIFKKQKLTEQEEQIQQLLDLKRRLFKNSSRPPESFSMPYDCLLHGDYQHFNVFADTQQITHIYDLERTALGPASYEIARAIFLDCFEDGWEEKNFNNAQLYLSAYRAKRALTLEAFTEAIEFYYYNVIHTSWIEANYLIYGVHQSLFVLERQHRRLLHLSTYNLRELAQAIWN